MNDHSYEMDFRTFGVKHITRPFLITNNSSWLVQEQTPTLPNQRHFAILHQEVAPTPAFGKPVSCGPLRFIMSTPLHRERSFCLGGTGVVAPGEEKAGAQVMVEKRREEGKVKTCR